MFADLLGTLEARLGRPQPLDPTLWHRWNTLLPVRLIDGSRYALSGQLWRRWGRNGWQYRVYPETDEEFERKIW